MSVVIVSIISPYLYITAHVKVRESTKTTYVQTDTHNTARRTL